MRDLRDRLDVEHVDLRIAQCFRVQQPRVVAQRLAEVLRRVGIHEAGLDAHLAQRDIELRVGAAVEQR